MVLTEWTAAKSRQSEVVILGTSHQLRAASANIQMIDVAGSRLAVLDRVKSLDVTIDSHLPFDSHASNMARRLRLSTSSSGPRTTSPRCLAARRRHRRGASSAVATLAAGSALRHPQDGGTDTQGPDDIDAIIPQRHAPHNGTIESAPIIRRTANYRPMHSN